MPSDWLSRRNLLLLCAVTLVAAGLRAIALNGGLWGDEIVTVLDFVRKPFIVSITEYGRNNHPLHSVLAHLSAAMLGERPWTVRLPAVAFGVACVPAVYAVGAAVASAGEGLLAAALLAVSYQHVWFSQNARGYTALAFFALLCAALMLRALRDVRLRWPIGYGVAGALGIYTHPAMGFVILAHGLGWLWVLLRSGVGGARRHWRGMVIGFIVAGAVSLMLYAPMIRQTYAVYRAPTPLGEAQSARAAIEETLGALRVGFGWWGALVSVLLFAFGLAAYWRDGRWFTATFILLPGALAFLGITALTLPMQPRFFFFLIGFGALGVARGALIAGNAIARGRGTPAVAVGIALVGLIIVANALSLDRLYRLPKQDYEGALRYVEAMRDRDDVVVAVGFAARPYREYYGRPWERVRSIEDLERVRAAGHRVWVLHTLLHYGNPVLLAWIRRECHPSAVFPGTLGGGEVFVCTL